MADHSKFVALAKRLIDKQGRTISLRTLAKTAADAAKPWKGPAAQVVAQEATVKAVFLPASGNDFSSMAISKELLAQVTQVALVAPHALDLAISTLMVDAGVQYKIEWVRVLKPADQVVLYAFGVQQ